MEDKIEIETVTTGYAVYRYVNGFYPYARKGPLKCAWCHKDLTRLGNKRLEIHIGKHDKQKQQ